MTFFTISDIPGSEFQSLLEQGFQSVYAELGVELDSICCVIYFSNFNGNNTDIQELSLFQF